MHFDRIAHLFTPAEYGAIREWQRSDRAYEAVQAALRMGVSGPRIDGLIERITLAISRQTLAEDAILWRGVRNTSGTFGVAATEITQLTGTTLPPFPGFLAMSTSRSVALEEFARPPLGGGPALIRAVVPRGTSFAWVARLGDVRLRRQRECLLDYQHIVRVGRAEYSGNIAFLDVEVLP